METVIGGACADIVLPCKRDRYYADSTSCNHYYRCQGYRIWRNKCPRGTTSMREGSTPCTGTSRHCNPQNPIQRCVNTTTTTRKVGCTLKFSLPCQEEKRFMDPKTCSHYFVCANVEQGDVLGRKPCDSAARCDRLTNSGHCSLGGGPSLCHKKGLVGVGERDNDRGETERGSEATVDHTALIVGLVMTTVISVLILGFLLLIFHKRKQKKKKPPSLPALSISGPIPIADSCHSPRYSAVDRPVSSVHYASPNNYSQISDGMYDPAGIWSNGAKGHNDMSPECCGIYEEIKPCPNDRPGLPPIPKNTGRKSPEIRPKRAIRPWSESFEVPARRPVTRPFSLTSLSAPRPPLEPPTDSCANLDQGYAHPYFVLPTEQYPSSPTSPSPNSTNPTKNNKYFILEKDSTRVDPDNISMATTYAEIDDAHFLQDNNDWRTSSFI